MNLRLWEPRAVLGALVVFYAVGLGGHLVPATLPWMLALTPWFLLGAGAALLVSVARGSDLGSLALWALPTLVVTFFLEALGVATGAVFGPYHYTPVLGTLFWGVPPVIGANWVLVVWGAHASVGRLVPRWPGWVRAGVTGLVCVAFDLLLEPVAIGLGYWVWHDPVVPLQNYVAWGLIAAAGSAWALRFPRLTLNPVLGWYVLVQALFFAVLGLAGVKA